jgi:microcystin-dependent protein
MVGEIKLWSGENIPAGWLACDGRTLNVVEYLPLYTVLGNLYGGNSTTFVLPDLRDRTVRGLNPVTQLLGSTTGSDYVTISNNNLPQHNHTATFSIHHKTFVYL